MYCYFSLFVTNIHTIVRYYGDTEILEVQMIENLQLKDVEHTEEPEASSSYWTHMSRVRLPNVWSVRVIMSSNASNWQTCLKSSRTFP